MDIGRVQWPTYKELFNFGYGGSWGILIIILISVLINLCTLSVSLYLAFTLSHRFKATNGIPAANSEDSEGTHDNGILLLIVVLSLTFSFAGKYLSNKIFMQISRGVHDKMVDSLTKA